MLGPILNRRDWQMTLGERAALEGVLAAVGPRLAIEIGTAEGGSLARIAGASQEVHSFDLEHDPARDWPANAHLHSGDSHEHLPRVLGELAEAGRRVDFVLVDGDHTADGVRQDVEDLLASPAIDASVVLIHDALNGEVRRGVDAVGLASRPEVAYFDLDFVAGHHSRSGPFAGQLWGGLGLVLVDREGTAFPALGGEREFTDAYEIFSAFAAGGGSGRLGLPRLRRSR